MISSRAVVVQLFFPPEQVSGDESTETFGTKKKKKKRKILQISKTVKSAVTAVTFTRKDVRKDQPKK